ncbi:unnamed protein product [Arctia plantaginis]|uniref:Uncharacterized protein n=1 Tax=Arctia plantaginis TaxID=874455 RepID=A0A8S1AD29_ARCPL|nr:unnamed protein product [Arctia plantaginis]
MATNASDATSAFPADKTGEKSISSSCWLMATGGGEGANTGCWGARGRDKPSAQDEVALKRERIYEGVLVLAGVRPLARTTRVVIKP